MRGVSRGGPMEGVPDDGIHPIVYPPSTTISCP